MLNIYCYFIRFFSLGIKTFSCWTSFHWFDVLNRLTSGLMMKSNQNHIDDSKDIVNGLKAIKQSENSEK